MLVYTIAEFREIFPGVDLILHLKIVVFKAGWSAEKMV